MNMNLQRDGMHLANRTFAQRLRRIERDLDPDATAIARGSNDFGCKVGYAIFAASMVVAMFFFLIGLMFVPTLFLIFVAFIIWYVGGLVIAAMNLIGLAFSIVGLAFSFRSKPALMGNLGSLFLNGSVVAFGAYFYRHLFAL